MRQAKHRPQRQQNKAAAKPKRRREPTPAPKEQPLSGRPVALDTDIITAWRQTLLSLARFPRGLNRRDHTEEELLNLVVRQEKPTVGKIWETYTQKREDLGRHFLGTKQYAVGYLLGFHLTNVARAQLLLERLDQRADLSRVISKLAQGPNAKVVWHDLGCGTGAMAQAVMRYLSQAGVESEAIELHLTDNTGALLDVARELMGRAAPDIMLRTHKRPLERLESSRLTKDATVAGYSLGYVWNELKNNTRGRDTLLSLLQQAAQVDERSIVLIMEPAIQDLARETMVLRDALTQSGYQPLYPCPSAAACPMLKRARDWCYSEGLWRTPLPIRRLDRLLGMDHSRLSGGLYAFASPALVASMSGRRAAPAVVVGRPETKPRGFDYLLCHAGRLSKEPGDPSRPLLPRGASFGGIKD